MSARYSMVASHSQWPRFSLPVRVCSSLPRRLKDTLGAQLLDAAVAVRAREFVTTGQSAVLELGDHAVFIETLIPPPQLVIFGAGDDARPLARFAAEIGFRVVVTDKRRAYLTTARFPSATALLDGNGFEQHLAWDESYAVVMSHNFRDDQEFLRSLLRTRVPFIGMLGPRQRTERILGNLSREGAFDESQRERIYGPVGLDIGTDGAEQVAMSIIAELLAVRSGRRVRSVRDRPVPIHAGDD